MRWDMRTALLSHTPMSKEGARHIESQVRDIEKSFEKTLRHFTYKDIKKRLKEPLVSTVRIINEGDDLGVLGKGLEVTDGGNR